MFKKFNFNLENLFFQALLTCMMASRFSSTMSIKILSSINQIYFMRVPSALKSKLILKNCSNHQKIRISYQNFSVESKLVVRGGNSNRQMNYYFISSENPTWDHNAVIEFGQFTNSRNITSRVETKELFSN